MSSSPTAKLKNTVSMPRWRWKASQIGTEPPMPITHGSTP
jgi:hypothetical protein